MPMTNDGLNIWVIYDHPEDFPTKFVLRRHVVTIDGATYATREAYGCDSIQPLREFMEREGLTSMYPFAGDDPNIVETWF